ncbi:MAG TPA: DUF6318 family protein [Aeromicrobium sp.]|nr:DUF6318 family protein [Aeromicrobium sp.]
MRRFALACAALLLLSACQTRPQPIEPTAAASARPAPASATKGSTVEPPGLPVITKRNDATGAANFVLYWVKVSNYAALTGDTELLREISAPACEGCRRYIELYEKTYADGGYFRGGAQKLKSVEYQKGAREHFFFCELLMAPGTFRRSRSSEPAITKGETSNVVFAVSRVGDSWIVTQIGPDPQ